MSISAATKWVFPAHFQMKEPELSFHVEDVDKRHWHPLEGLIAYGPYGSSLLTSVRKTIKIATIYPEGFGGILIEQMRQLNAKQMPQERRDYLPTYPGFEALFGSSIDFARQEAHVEIPLSFDTEMRASTLPHIALFEQLSRTISLMRGCRHLWDVLVILLPRKWESGFKGVEDDFDLHDHLKALCAGQGFPIQIIREDGAASYKCRASVAWRTSIALYCKAGGIPWKLAEVEPDVAYIGLAYALRTQGQKAGRFVTCCSQVFDAEGTGMEFLAYDAGEDVKWEGDNPFLSRTQMLRLMSRSLRLYQDQHAGSSPRRVVIYKTTPFKDEEIEGCFEAWRAPQGVELIQIQQDSPWRGIHVDKSPATGQTSVGGYPCLRGSYLPLSGRDVLLWTQGDVPLSSKKHFYKEGKGIPSPLLLKRYGGHGSWDNSCRMVLALTKMNWNNDSLYDRLPVTLNYASLLARVFKRIPQTSTLPYQFRFFM